MLEATLKRTATTLVVAIAVLVSMCIGWETRILTSKATGGRKQVFCLYLPFWGVPRMSAFVLYCSEKKLDSGVERFLLRHAFQNRTLPEAKWNADQAGACTWWGWGCNISLRSPGLYGLLAAHSEEEGYNFLEAYHESHPELVVEIRRFLQDPNADWVTAWRAKLYRDYLHQDR
jgi:hypothetical protein